ncbi:MAG: hypothetical protein E7458_04810 [Ruminococcaceae bacterium]|nr:hypothetical protein [Oscillospiraceae bacterium]
MNAISYLILTRMKNTLRNLLRSPAKLIYVLILAAAMGFTFFAGNLETDPNRPLRDVRELIAGVGGLCTLMFLLLAYSGFGAGGSFFRMPDVNLIFPAPFPQRSVLLYGLIQQAGSSMLLGFFMLFQYTWMHELYNISFGFLLILMLAYGASVFLGQFVAMVLYVATSADERRRRIARILYVCYIALILCLAAAYVLPDLDAWAKGLVAAANSPLFFASPVSGWLTYLVSGILTCTLSDCLIALGLLVGVTGLLFALIQRLGSDFYEDVIKTAETAQSAINASRQGAVAETTPARVKVGKTGFSRGMGAAAIYEKHKLEDRRSRVLILDKMSLIWVVMVILFGFFMKEEGLIPVFVMATYFQFFSVSMGRFNRELTKPYIYLMPEPPLRKMLHALRESLPAAVLEAIVMFVPLYFIMGFPLAELVCAILARISFSLLFLAGNVVLMRIWHGRSSKMFTMLLYFGIMLLLMLPGILLVIMALAASQVLALAVVSEIALSFVILTISNTLFGLLALFLCRNMLQYAELSES